MLLLRLFLMGLGVKLGICEVKVWYLCIVVFIGFGYEVDLKVILL